MIQIENIKKVYFIGIGGIGMSAIARYFHARGIEVSGYDKTPTQLTKTLEQSGINIIHEEHVGLIPKDVQLVVFTPAVPAAHAALLYYRQNGYQVLKRSEVLELISKSSFNICVAGTHGKTTITAMIAHILRHSGFGCNAFLGGIATNYNTNFWSDPNNVCVIEADEYDRSFLRLNPDIAIISSMDPDHLDIYGTEQTLQQAFIDFSKKVKQGGMLLTIFGLKRGREMKADELLTYSLQNEAADVNASNIQIMSGSYVFNVMLKGSILDRVVLNMGGMHNVENVVAAITVAHRLGISGDKIKAAVEAFAGVKRRFEYIVKTGTDKEGIIYIDDYAHHPEELKALITGARTLFKQRTCTVVFQPHLFTRTRDLASAFAESLDLADTVILLPVYPARELPIEGISSNTIAERMQNKHVHVITKEELLPFLQNRFLTRANQEYGELLITAGAGDIDQLVEPLKKIIQQNEHINDVQ
ncbi:MAG: UDP-N-acetylmuramate--L-alanine ligase [Chitinophagaceae bacterium]